MTQYILIAAARDMLNKHGVAVATRTITEWITKGNLGGRRIGNRWYVRTADIEALLSDQSSSQA